MRPIIKRYHNTNKLVIDWLYYKVWNLGNFVRLSWFDDLKARRARAQLVVDVPHVPGISRRGLQWASTWVWLVKSYVNPTWAWNSTQNAITAALILIAPIFSPGLSFIIRAGFNFSHDTVDYVGLVLGRPFMIRDAFTCQNAQRILLTQKRRSFVWGFRAECVFQCNPIPSPSKSTFRSKGKNHENITIAKPTHSHVNVVHSIGLQGMD